MIRRWYNYDPSCAFEEVDETSLAVPDQTYSVRELFDRMARGLSLDGSVRPVYYDDSEDIDNPDPTQRPDFELSDYTEEAMNLESRLQSARSAQPTSPKNEVKKDNVEPSGEKEQS